MNLGLRLIGIFWLVKHFLHFQKALVVFPIRSCVSAAQLQSVWNVQSSTFSVVTTSLDCPISTSSGVSGKSNYRPTPCSFAWSALTDSSALAIDRDMSKISSTYPIYGIRTSLAIGIPINGSTSVFHSRSTRWSRSTKRNGLPGPPVLILSWCWKVDKYHPLWWLFHAPIVGSLLKSHSLRFRDNLVQSVP